jgi:predicted nucleic acid-binding protein
VIVLDASAAVELLLNTGLGSAVAARVGREPVHAPHLLVVEVAQALRRLAAGGEVAAERGAAALTDLRDLGVEHHDHLVVVDRAWELRANVTAYDAMYVALAELLDAPLVTCDGRLATAPGHGARVEVVSPR